MYESNILTILPISLKLMVVNMVVTVHAQFTRGYALDQHYFRHVDSSLVATCACGSSSYLTPG